jgi:hypothetical protein
VSPGATEDLVPIDQRRKKLHNAVEAQGVFERREVEPMGWINMGNGCNPGEFPIVSTIMILYHIREVDGNAMKWW